jgi:hypothetical protein
MARTRNYQAEYRQRIARGLARGVSRSQARGHPGKREEYVSLRHRERRINDQLEAIRLEAQQTGKSLTSLARSKHVAPERAIRYLDEQCVLEHRGNRYGIDDQRLRETLIYSRGKAYTITVPSYAEVELIGRYMDAVDDFLRSNDPSYLKPFVGQSVTDTKGRRHVLETRPNSLYRVRESDHPSYEQVYKIISPL